MSLGISGYQFLPGQFTLSSDTGKLGMTYLGILQSAFLTVYGAKEIVLDRARVSVVLDYSTLHGTLLFASGFFGYLIAFHQLEMLNLDVCCAKPMCLFLGDFLFVSANFLAIKYNAGLYQDAASRPRSAHTIQMMRSAVLGIVSNLHYILAAITPIFGFSTAIALLFGCIAVSTGAVKIVYDFFLESR